MSDERDPIVRARDVSKSFDGERALDGIDLAVYDDETTLLLGPNGSGKTILLSCLAGGLSPSAGDIEVFGERPRDVGGATSFMLQDSLAFPNLTGRENVEFYCDLHSGATDDWRGLADRLALSEADLDRKVREYSGGMVRKLELVVTLSVDVPLYFLDEPTAELDMTTVDRVHAVARQRRDAGKAVVMSSHAPVDAQLADRIVIVRDGRVVETGEPDELMADVPPVVTLDGTVSGADLLSTVRCRRFFERNDERRGFLRTDADEAAVADRGAAVEAPTVGDLFNYYVHVLPEERSPESEPTARASE